MAGHTCPVSRFPTTLGRSASEDIQLVENGVWERHLEIGVDPARGFIATSAPEAGSLLNGVPFQKIRLRNGDYVQIGAVKFQVWLLPVAQRSFKLREWMFWFLFAAIPALQLAIVVWLML